MQEPIIILGAGGHAKVVIETARLCGFWPVSVFDDNEHLLGLKILGVEIKGSIKSLPDELFVKAFIAIGCNHIRKKLCHRFKQIQWVTLIHPKASLSENSILQDGTLICAGAIIQPNVEIGRHTIVNIGACVDHDCVVGDYAHIAQNATLAGGVKIGEGVLISVASTVLPAMSVDNWLSTKPGEVLTKDLRT